MDVLYCTALYCTVLYCTALHCTALHCIALHCTALHCAVLYCAVLYCTVLYCTALYCTALCCAALGQRCVMFCLIQPALLCTSRSLTCALLYCRLSSLLRIDLENSTSTDLAKRSHYSYSDH